MGSMNQLQACVVYNPHLLTSRHEDVRFVSAQVKSLFNATCTALKQDDIASPFFLSVLPEIFHVVGAAQKQNLIHNQLVRSTKITRDYFAFLQKNKSQIKTVQETKVAQNKPYFLTDLYEAPLLWNENPITKKLAGAFILNSADLWHDDSRMHKENDIVTLGLKLRRDANDKTSYDYTAGGLSVSVKDNCCLIEQAYPTCHVVYTRHTLNNDFVETKSTDPIYDEQPLSRHYRHFLRM